MVWTIFRFVVFSMLLCGLLPQMAAADGACWENRRLHYLERVQKHFETADVVFFGVVVEEETPPRPTRSPLTVSDKESSSMAQLLEAIESSQSSAPQPPRMQSVTFKVDRSWKGLVGPDLVARASLFFDDTGGHSVFREGDSYLVFAFESGVKDAFHIPVACASHESVAETDSMIRLLDALTKKPGD